MWCSPLHKVCRKGTFAANVSPPIWSCNEDVPPPTAPNKCVRAKNEFLCSLLPSGLADP